MSKFFWFLKYRILIFIILFFMICSVLIKGYFSLSVEEYVKFMCTNEINNMIITTINEEVADNLPFESLMKVTYNSDNEVVYAYIDTQTANTILSQTGIRISELSGDFNARTRSVDIPLGYLFNTNVFFANSLTVPIEVSNILSYNVKLETTVEEYGINSSLVTINLVYDFYFKSMIPLITSDVNVNNKVILSSSVLYGDVPNYYFTGEKPNISVS